MVELKNHNPDVISCLASLSNDEVFTPPSIVNDMLDMLPMELWSNPDAKFLDPCCKSGVFLREIAKRLIVGLNNTIPDLQDRLNHIFNKQLYGLAITELTSLLSRRSVYCSKNANGKYSVCSDFDNEVGNIIYVQSNHIWQGNRCASCGVNKDVYERAGGYESYAYPFIHPVDLGALSKMKFDVIIGNPPYQMNDGGGDGTSAAPIYQLFIEQAKKLNPQFLVMIVPARWYSGGKGLDDFRQDMLTDHRLSIIHDFPQTSDCFPGLNIRGGVCYFLWDSSHKGDCIVYNHMGSDVNYVTRPLLEKNAETFIRYNKAISILRKVSSLGEETMDNRVSSRLPFGIPSNFELYSETKNDIDYVTLYRSERGNNKDSNREYFVNPDYITKNIEWKDKMKVLVSKASPGGDEYPHAIISEPIFASINSVCTETYLIVDFVDSNQQGSNLISYMKTKFFRFLMSLIKNTQNISKGVFSFVPVQNYDEVWDDAKLYLKYQISEDEINFIDSMIRPMG